MYVDDSGSPSYADHTKYFVLSGVIVHDEEDIKRLQRSVFQYKQDNFTGKFVDSEIHTHDIYKAKNDFESIINLSKKIELLDNLYCMIENTDCVGIIVVINKDKLKKEKPTWRVFNTAWSYLIERYDKYLEDHNIETGEIKIDKSSNRFQKETITIIRDIIDNGTRYQRKAHLQYPRFVDSSGVYGIQIADAFAYCGLGNKTNEKDFAKYFEIVWAKLRENNFGTKIGYGYKEYPK